jgi:hypothetical protein
MSSKGNLSEGAKLHAKDAARRAQPWMERLARLGYATEGAVYALIGVLAAGAPRASAAPSNSLQKAPSEAWCWV